MKADPNRRYLLTDPDVDLKDEEFVKSLTPEGFKDLLIQTLESGGPPADLSGAPSAMQEGDYVALFNPPRPRRRK
ncbi:hypothetical protein GOARA_047_00140 [Gordonia araii NBRC 100433]|uniref:Uncharacterized protein n=1 Tax=Gordonia araii NBRC 100433 TaxID=1073574 RepID=G7H1Q4_9ACTN|nr:hypothetical protein [Gordonia araii]NNG99229.1 hypothetical protein [Gordonia araii NBRC 100433]GAB09779.1 hypothetical protein GOARA_047_00140 [Gordonia araii NBRC 100433]